MTDPQHLAMLNEGVPAWNEWRSLHPKILPCLRGAGREYDSGWDWDCTINVSLSGADLSRADLARAYLSGADLSSANFSEANLIKADLRRADLRKADLTGVNLTWADLSGADLSGADLSYANLNQTDLSDATLDQAEVGHTTFGDTDLSAVKGLETVTHRGPSTIGTDTIYRSQGKIPEAFLRGAGLPDDLISYVGSLVTGKAIEFYSCFICYSSKDQEFVKRLHADLQSKGVRCWFAAEDLKIGDKFHTRIDESIRVHDKLMVILSRNSIESSWVEEEVEAALEKERSQNKLVLFPIRLDDAVMQTQQAWAASLRRIRNMGDFTKWKDRDSYQKAFERLLRDLRAEQREGETA